MSESEILCLNSGSSSLKFALYRMETGRGSKVMRGAVERIGPDEGRIWTQNEKGETTLDRPYKAADHAAAVHAVFEVLGRRGPQAPLAVGHRLVHGGPDHRKPQLIDTSVLDSLKRSVPFAPLHLPAEIAGIEAVAAKLKNVPQVVCFDTTFHCAIPEIARRFPLPSDLYDAGVYRYGFHGLSCEYVVDRVGPAMLGRAVIAHLGNGASLTAVQNGRSVDTTMGLTPTGGVMMGTRSGDLDPGVLLYLLERKGYQARSLERLLNAQSGLLGVSGRSSDMKTLLDCSASDPGARTAVEMFCYQVRKSIGALTAALGGLDSLVFTGGIGERAAPVREQICSGLSHLGIRIDPGRNNAHAELISTDDGPCAVRVIATDEEWIIARHTRQLVVVANLEQD